MANEIPGLSVKIGANNDELDRALDRSEGRLRKFGTNVRAGVNTLGKFSVAATAAGAAITAGLVKAGLESADSQAKLAQQINGTVGAVKTLTRVGKDAGVSTKEMEQAQRRLLQTLGEAREGTGSQAEAIEKLGLNTSELVNIDADARFAAIADAIRDYGDAADQSAVMADIFGARAGTKLAVAIQSGGDAIRAARKEIDELGLGMSDVDAAKIEIANDQMDRLNDVFESATQHLAKEFAPILTAISQQMQGMAKDAGGVGGQVGIAFEKGIQAAAFMANAIDGVSRVFESMADSVLIGMTTLVGEMARKVETLLNLANQVPYVDLDAPLTQVRNFAANMEGVTKQAGLNMKRNLEEPLAGDAFLANVRDAQAKAQKAAEEMAANRPDVGGLSSGAMSDEEKEGAKKRIQEEVGLLWERFDQETEAYEKHQARLNAIEQRGIKTRRDYEVATASQRLSFMSGTMSKIISGVSNGNKKMAKIAQDLALFQVGVSLPAAVMEAVKNAGGMPFGAWAGAATLAEGIGRINQIKSQSLGSGGAGVTSSSPSGGSAAASGGAGQVSGATGQPMQQVQISGLDPDSIFKGSQFIDAANKAQEEGYQLVF